MESMSIISRNQLNMKCFGNIGYGAVAVFSCFLACLAVSEEAGAQTLRRAIDVPDKAVESRWEKNAQGDTELNYYVNDWCDYYLFRINDRSYDLKPGKNTVYRKIEGSQSYNPFMRSGSYYRFRGGFPGSFDISVPYALPVRPGAETSWRMDRRERSRTMNFRMAAGDTVYAVRSGVACLTEDRRLLLVYHNDRTFAAYLMMAENMTAPGEDIRVGQPVGIAGSSGVSLSFFFLDRNKFDGYEAAGYMYTHFIPVFRTSAGDVRPEEQTVYVSVVDDGLIMQDMNRKEQKRYLRERDRKSGK